MCVWACVYGRSDIAREGRLTWMRIQGVAGKSVLYLLRFETTDSRGSCALNRGGPWMHARVRPINYRARNIPSTYTCYRGNQLRRTHHRRSV